MITKKHQPEKSPGEKERYVFSVKVKKYVFQIIARKGNIRSLNELMVSKLSPLLGELLLITGGFVLLFAGVYPLTLWWRIILQFEFWEFIVSVILLPITIPLAPIYLGVKGDWGPTGVFIFAIILGVLLLEIGSRLYKLNLTNKVGSHR